MNAPEPRTGRIDGLAVVIAAAIDVLHTSSRRASMFAPKLEARLWNQPAIIDALRGFAISGRDREVRILVAEPTDLARDCGALVVLQQRLPTALPLREPLEGDEWPASHPFLLADEGTVLRFDSDGRLGGELIAADAGQGRIFQTRFDAAWERARPMSELRVLGI
ncbi:MAG: hypothetical protein JF567_01630 [Xanthomonadales bacterium]|nr:hypothetical protein [Xanthomonadales bacterium]